MVRPEEQWILGDVSDIITQLEDSWGTGRLDETGIEAKQHEKHLSTVHLHADIL